MINGHASFDTAINLITVFVGVWLCWVLLSPTVSEFRVPARLFADSACMCELDVALLGVQSGHAQDPTKAFLVDSPEYLSGMHYHMWCVMLDPIKLIHLVASARGKAISNETVHAHQIFWLNSAPMLRT